METDNFFEDENVLTRKFFDLEKLLDFQLKHDIQIIRGADYQYMCYIDGKVYAIALTPMNALAIGIHNFLK
jgi:hypothetical protein